jgi:hypothetical protein
LIRVPNRAILCKLLFFKQHNSKQEPASTLSREWIFRRSREIRGGRLSDRSEPQGFCMSVLRCGNEAARRCFMFFVQCPQCGSVVEIPADAVGSKRRDPWNVAECPECDSSFDYDDDEVQFEPGTQGVL